MADPQSILSRHLGPQARKERVALQERTSNSVIVPATTANKSLPADSVFYFDVAPQKASPSASTVPKPDSQPVRDASATAGRESAVTSVSMAQIKAKVFDSSGHSHWTSDMMSHLEANSGPGSRWAPTVTSVRKELGLTKKRKAADAEPTLAEEIAAYKQDLSDKVDKYALEDMKMVSCEAVRNRINKLLDAGIMNKTEFARAIGGSTASLSGFLSKTGRMGGAGSVAYQNAFAWFKQREIAGLKMPDVKKRQKLDMEKKAAAAAAGVSGSSVAAAAKSVPDVSNIFLPGESEDDVHVFDSCDEVRRKINKHLLLPGLTKAEFCRKLTAQLCGGKTISTDQLATFRGKKGAISGAKAPVFYAAYVYFEKLRIAEKKPKTAHRDSMEALWPCGLDRTRDDKTQYITMTGSSLSVDEFGFPRSFHD